MRTCNLDQVRSVNVGLSCYVLDQVERERERDCGKLVFPTIPLLVSIVADLSSARQAMNDGIKDAAGYPDVLVGLHVGDPHHLMCSAT